ncbi:carboxymuconolactone decarboxylase family protein [Microbulbifer celer]
MSRITLIENPADERVKAIFEDVRTQMGGIPYLFRAYANSPPLLEHFWEQYRNLMFIGRLSRPLKEAIALMVSADNHCDYGISLHSHALESLGVPAKEILRIRTDPDHAHFPPKEHVLLEVARHANIAPHDHGERLITEARKTEATDAEILEALAVSGMIAGTNRTADMLGLQAMI